MRAIGDKRLSGTHFNALGAIAYFDRMSKARGRGAGCYASYKVIAARANVNPTNLSTAINELARWGYVTAEPHPMNKRTRVYRVVYDTLPDGKASNAEPASDCLPEGKVLKPGQAADALPDGKAKAETLCPPISQPIGETEKQAGQHMLLSKNISCETETYSAKRPPLRVGQWPGRSAGGNPGATLAMIERALTDGGTLDAASAQAVIAISEQAEANSPIYHQATRILQKWDAANAA